MLISAITKLACARKSWIIIATASRWNGVATYSDSGASHERRSSTTSAQFLSVGIDARGFLFARPVTGQRLCFVCYIDGPQSTLTKALLHIRKKKKPLWNRTLKFLTDCETEALICKQPLAFMQLSAHTPLSNVYKMKWYRNVAISRIVQSFIGRSQRPQSIRYWEDVQNFEELWRNLPWYCAPT